MDRDTFGLNYANPLEFTVSQWGQKSRVSAAYCIYRTLLALYFSISYVVFWAGDDTPGIWLAYLTNQGMVILVIHLLSDMVLVYRTFINQTHLVPTYRKMELAQKLSWILANISTSLAIFISGFFWIFLFPLEKENSYQNMFLHALNSICVLIDLAVVARPMRWQHFYMPLLYGVFYVIFSAIYWACGGTDPDGNHFLYPMLDWDKPGPTMATVFGAAAGICIVHFCALGMTHFRKYVFRRYYEARFQSFAKSEDTLLSSGMGSQTL